MSSTPRNATTDRVMLMQETGEERGIENTILGRDRAQASLEQTLAQHAAGRGWIERERHWRFYRLPEGLRRLCWTAL